MDESMRGQVSRRTVLKQGAAAAAGGAAGLLGGREVLAQAPAVATGAQAGRPFRAWVQQGAQAGVEDLRLLPLQPRQVLIRTEASAPCYTMVMRGIGGTPAIPPVGPAAGPGGGGGNAPAPQIQNHCGVGVVEAVSPDVKRVRPGDRVIVGVTSYCGQCYMCLRGRADHCQFTMAVVGGFPSMAERADGTPVGASIGLGGLSELMVVYEEYTCPVFTDVPPAQIALLGDTVATGFAAGMCLMRIEPGADVVVLGAGAVGLGAVQAARVMGAGQVIVSEPVAHRRALAQQLGATTVLDPNAEGDGLVERIRELCKGPTDRWFAGGRGWDTLARNDNRGADFTIEAVGRTGDRPAVEQPPDPTGVVPLRQAWEFTRRGGEIVYLGFGQPGEVSYPATAFANRGRTVHAGQQGGLNMMRDLPRFIRLVEKGDLDLISLVTSTWSLDETRQALQVLSDRTELAPVVVF
jgi:S-(hydroxymethyl)glutathione dehydrogenase/alcohol dehydrogenase